MPSNYEKLPNEPIILVTMSPDYNLSEEMPKMMPKAIEMLEKQPEPVFWVVDISAVVHMTINDLILGAELVSKGQYDLYHHPKIKQVVYVTNSEMMKAAVVGMKNEAFGKINIKVFDKREDALGFIRGLK